MTDSEKEQMGSKEARKILRAMQHAQELAKEGTLYGEVVTEHTRNKKIEALDYAIKLQDKIDYKIEALEEELNNLCGKHARGGGKPIAMMTRIHEIAYALEILRWLNIEEWVRND